MSARTPQGPAAVTDRQREVASLIARGQTNREIAETLGITLDGAKHHVSQLLIRLNLQRREEIAAWHKKDTSVRRLGFSTLPLLLFGGAAAVAAVVAVVVGIVLLTQGPAPQEAVGSSVAAPTLAADLPASGVPSATPDTFEVTSSDLARMVPDLAELIAVTPLAPGLATTGLDFVTRTPLETERGRGTADRSGIVGATRAFVPGSNATSGQDNADALLITTTVHLFLSPTHALAEFAEMVVESQQVITGWEVIDEPGEPASGLWDDAVRINERAGSDDRAGACWSGTRHGVRDADRSRVHRRGCDRARPCARRTDPRGPDGARGVRGLDHNRLTISARTFVRHQFHDAVNCGVEVACYVLDDGGEASRACGLAAGLGEAQRDLRLRLRSTFA